MRVATGQFWEETGGAIKGLLRTGCLQSVGKTVRLFAPAVKKTVEL